MGPIEARTPQSATPAVTGAEPAPALAPPAPAHPMPIPAVGRVAAPPPRPTPPSDEHPLARLQPRSAGPVVIRRTPDWEKGKRQDGALDDFVIAADQLVMDGASVALTRFNDLTAADGYTARWKTTALRMIMARDALSPLRVKFGAARYGYAVESYVTQHLSSVASKLPAGYKYGTQIGKGSTRPDILVFDRQGQDVGWFDITSHRSRGHIHKKFSTGWRTKPYVTELLYPNFDLSRLSPGSATAEEMAEAQQKYQNAQAQWQGFLAECRTDFDDVHGTLMAELNKEVPSKADRQGVARQAMAQCFEEDDCTPTECMNLLRALGHHPKDFGWRVGGSKNAGLTVLRGYYDAAQQEEETPEEDAGSEDEVMENQE